MNIVIDKNVAVVMRDGVRLAADVYRLADGQARPALVQRMPYNKELPSTANTWVHVMRAVQRGYAVVVQDVRGRYASEGEFAPFANEAADGYDTIEWIARQEWCTGAVGMIGGSYVGATQWLAAAASPPSLRAIAPAVTTDQYHDGWTYEGGAFQLGFVLFWCLSAFALNAVSRAGTGDATARAAAVVTTIDDIDAVYGRIPLTDIPELADIVPFYAQWLEHPTYDEFWRDMAPRERYDAMTVSTFNIGGWYDPFLRGTIANFVAMQDGRSAAGGRSHRLLVGPWAHGATSGTFPEGSFGFLSGSEGVDTTQLQLDFFDAALAGSVRPGQPVAPVRVFVMGANRWREADTWPLPNTRYASYFLSSGGSANTCEGDGELGEQQGAGADHDEYRYDPRDPVPTHGGATFLPGLFVSANSGPRDQRSIEARHDVLCYTSAELAEPLEVIGPVEVELYVSSDAPDTDFTAKLVDVHPDGSAINLCDSIVRMRYREGGPRPARLSPNEVYPVTIDLAATANRLGVGHRIRLEISSSNFPRFDRNTNRGEPVATDREADMQTATNRVFHTPRHPSRLVLPVLDS